MPRKRALKKLIIQSIKWYFFGLLLSFFLISFLYNVVPVSWLVTIKSVNIEGDKYVLVRSVNVTTLEARSIQELHCAISGEYVGERNTDWFVMSNSEGDTARIPFVASKFTPVKDSIYICGEQGYVLKVQYFIRSNYFQNRFYNKVFTTNTFYVDEK